MAGRRCAPAAGPGSDVAAVSLLSAGRLPPQADPRITDYDTLLANIKDLKEGRPAQVRLRAVRGQAAGRRAAAAGRGAAGRCRQRLPLAGRPWPPRWARALRRRRRPTGGAPTLPARLHNPLGRPQVPIYDFKESRRVGYRTVEVPPSRVVILEGIYALNARLRPMVRPRRTPPPRPAARLRAPARGRSRTAAWRRPLAGGRPGVLTAPAPPSRRSAPPLVPAPQLDLRVSITGGVHFDLVKRVLRDINRSGQAPEEIIQQVGGGRVRWGGGAGRGTGVGGRAPASGWRRAAQLQEAAAPPDASRLRNAAGRSPTPAAPHIICLQTHPLAFVSLERRSPTPSTPCTRPSSSPTSRARTCG